MQWEFLDVWNQWNVCGNCLEPKWICLLVQRPLSSSNSARPRRWFIGHVLPLWASKPHQLTARWILSSWQNGNLQVLQYIEHSKEQDICEQLLGGQRWVETFAFYLWVCCSCWQVSVHSWQRSRGKQRLLLTEGRRPVSASARDWESWDYSPQLQVLSWATSAGRVFLLTKKIISECLVVLSCTERSRNVMISLINSSKEYSKCWGCLQTHFQLNLKKVRAELVQNW